MPTAFTGSPSSAARRTAAASSSTEAGVTSRAGRTETVSPSYATCPSLVLVVLPERCLPDAAPAA
ncbi:hypothetical protein SALBM217S_10877 [Streptomyces griseoloalbus]